MALARMADGAHWISDTLVGDTYGWFIGESIANRYLERDRDDDVSALSNAAVVVRFSWNHD
jgi:membrane-associated phospholipid phosphatase